MVERELQEGRTAPIPERNTRVLETTLAKLGVDTTFDTLNLAGDGLTLGVKKAGEETIFVGRLNHPFAGEHFAQFLNSVAPFGDQNRHGIMADVELRILAEHDYREGKDRTTSIPIQLHERHLQDRRVGLSYKRFAQDHVDAWLKALEHSTGWQVFAKLQRIRFINSKENVRRELFSEDGDIMKPLDNIRERYRMSSAIKNYGDLRFKFFCLRKGLKEREAVQSFLKTLSIGEQGEFAVTYFMDSKRQTFVNLETKRIREYRGDYYGPIEKGRVRFADNRRDVVISDNTETKVVITPTGQDNERFSWTAVEYQFPEDYIGLSLYPVIAWKKDENGARSFLTQEEAMPYVAELGLPEGKKGDVKLGEIAVAYFGRDITQDWKRKMTLAPLEGTTSRRGDDFEQPMMGAQMPVWVSMPHHREQLLSDENPFFGKIEDRINSAL